MWAGAEAPPKDVARGPQNVRNGPANIIVKVKSIIIITTITLTQNIDSHYDNYNSL